LGVVHRLDRDTSGVVLFTRTADAKRKLAVQFRDHTIERIYHAIAQGSVPEVRIETDLVMDRGDGLRGSHGHYRRAKGALPSDAKHSITFVKPIEALRGATLVECKLATGRQHQIRIHLSELGHPIVGERVYIRDYAGPKIEAPRAMLHARTLGFMHPRNGKRLSFEREAPADFLEMAGSLRR
jgi:23S rRNA pseudouridine1911/1915/1917 synthase